MHSSSSAMCISPIGIVNACDPRRAAAEAFAVAGLIHGGPSDSCRDAAASMAAAVAEAMRPAANPESVVTAATAHLHRKSCEELVTCITDCLEAARTKQDYKAFRCWFYENCLRETIADPRETVPCALALFLLADGDPKTTVRYGANFGRDADTIASMAGAVAGALKGAAALPEDWIAKVENDAPGQRELAGELSELAEARVSELKKTLTECDKLLA